MLQWYKNVKITLKTENFSNKNEKIVMWKNMPVKMWLP